MSFAMLIKLAKLKKIKTIIKEIVGGVRVGGGKVFGIGFYSEFVIVINISKIPKYDGEGGVGGVKLFFWTSFFS
jgi:hypothetical protein